MNVVATVTPPESAVDISKIPDTDTVFPRLFDPERDKENIDPLVEYIGEKTRMHILDRGVPSLASFAIDVTRQSNRLQFDYVKSAHGNPWIIEHTITVDLHENDDADKIIGEYRDCYDACLNWDATGI